jgi:4-nitrophenyl phosphatase
MNNEKRFRLALLDLDGTLWRDGVVIPGAPAFVERLRRQGVQPVFFTNNSSRTPDEVVAVLAKCAIQAAANEVCTTAQAAAHVLQQRLHKGASVMYVGRDGVRTALLEADFMVRRAQGDALGEAWLQDVDAVVVGMDQRVTYLDLAVVARVIARLGWFVLTNPDVRLPVEDGFLPGNGAQGALLSTATGVSPIVTGKPDPSFIDFALQRYQVSREETVIIGDNLYTDILAGQQASVHSIMVRSGVVFPPADDAPIPDETVDSVDVLFRNEAVN